MEYVPSEKPYSPVNWPCETLDVTWPKLSAQTWFYGFNHVADGRKSALSNRIDWAALIWHHVVSLGATQKKSAASGSKQNQGPADHHRDESKTLTLTICLCHYYIHVFELKSYFIKACHEVTLLLWLLLPEALCSSAVCPSIFPSPINEVSTYGTASTQASHKTLKSVKLDVGELKVLRSWCTKKTLESQLRLL